MYPVLFEVFGRQIGTYGLLIITGAVAAWFLVKVLDKNKDKNVPLVFLICMCGGLVGAFLLRPITRIPEIIIHWEHFRQMPAGMALSLIFGDIVFYGGLIGGVIAMLIFCKSYKIPILPIADLFAPALAVAHGFGRIGCFLGGCCYGIQVHPSHPFAVIFPSVATEVSASISITTGVPTGVPMLATQLIEAVSLFIIAAILIIIYKKTAVKGLTVCSYGILYSILRFTLEFYRGDSARGIYGIFSISQYISIALFVVSVVMAVLLHILRNDRIEFMNVDRL